LISQRGLPSRDCHGNVGKVAKKMPLGRHVRPEHLTLHPRCHNDRTGLSQCLHPRRDVGCVAVNLGRRINYYWADSMPMRVLSGGLPTFLRLTSASERWIITSSTGGGAELARAPPRAARPHHRQLAHPPRPATSPVDDPDMKLGQDCYIVRDAPTATRSPTSIRGGARPGGRQRPGISPRIGPNLDAHPCAGDARQARIPAITRKRSAVE
jgi:hypothetical protein